jgi:hypothetical protein
MSNNITSLRWLGDFLDAKATSEGIGQGSEAARICWAAATEIEAMRQQLAACQQREVMLRSSFLSSANYIDTLGGTSIEARRTLAATTDLDGLILCDAEPVGYYRPTDSGFCAGYSSEKLNDKWEPTFRAWEPK